MKKFLIVMLALVLMMCLVAPAAMAEEFDATLTVETVTAKAGDEVKLAVTIDKATFATYLVEIVCDEGLEIVSIEEGKDGQGLFSASIEGFAGAMLNKDAEWSGELFVITLKVSEEATEGEYTVSLKVDNFTMADATTSLDVAVAEGAVVIAHEHSYTAVVTAPTCTEKGYTTYTCSCGDSYVDDYVDATGHSWGEWVVTTPATCTENGVETRTCSVCGETETRVIEATGHVDADGDGFCDNCDMAMPSPDTGDSIYVAVAAAVISMMGIVALTKKREF